jgi:ribosomal protein S18 acetylase RimI-like enzyme
MSFFSQTVEGHMVRFRIKLAARDDSSDLAALADMATRRLASFLWAQGACDGDSLYEFGRSIIRDNSNSSAHYSQWQIAEMDGVVLGGMNGYVLSEAMIALPSPTAAAIVKPLNDLKAMAFGSWYIAALAVFKEARGLGVGRSLLQSAEQSAKAASVHEITLMVGSFNTNARRLYEGMGYEARAQRDFIGFEGSDRAGHWILMAKSVRETSA